ncbi:hypothetical protein [Phaeospirillum tilakii]|uniref:Uncharacterized protein n=1 Tax=Phaeospirillum tilakii TaxID=741673 RepID=A0ABW5CAH6_9PROT
MSAPPPPSREEWLRAELVKASSLVGTARRLLATGTMVDLTALEGRIRLICDGVTRLEPDSGRTLRADMEALLADLDRLAAALEAANPCPGEPGGGTPG